MCRWNLLLVEPFESSSGTTGLLVGVGTLPVLKVERGFREQVKRVLSLGLLRNEVIILIIVLLLLLGLLLSLRGRSSSGLGLLLLLGRRYKLESLLGVLDRAEDLLECRLVDDGLGVTENVGELLARLSIENNSACALNDGCEGDISKGNALANKVCAGGKVVLNSGQSAESTLNEGSVELKETSSVDTTTWI